MFGKHQHGGQFLGGLKQKPTIVDKLFNIGFVARIKQDGTAAAVVVVVVVVIIGIIHKIPQWKRGRPRGTIIEMIHNGVKPMFRDGSIQMDVNMTGTHVVVVIFTIWRRPPRRRRQRRLGWCRIHGQGDAHYD
eukprot:scaffold42784_cov214-Amphora_coffeaeformis.AAC.10